jgi:hypothetical protein
VSQVAYGNGGVMLSGTRQVRQVAYANNATSVMARGLRLRPHETSGKMKRRKWLYPLESDVMVPIRNRYY